MSCRTFLRTLACAGSLLLVPVPSFATVFTASGTGSMSGGANPVSAEAIFMTSGSTLTLTLVNTSTNGSRLHPEQVLTSFYFDLPIHGGRVNLLACTGGSGSVYRLVGGGTAAQPVIYVPPVSGTAFTPGSGPSNLLASGTDYDTWAFRGGLNVGLPPQCFYGIGTVGNSAFAPNGFDSKIVGAINFGIFAGDASDPQGELKKLPYLVSGSATFTFTADRNIDDLEFIDPFVFGFGSGPAQTIILLPEPSGVAPLAGASVVCWGLRRRRRWP